jgi:uncharacterized delta-60 repeat protein
MGGMQLRAPRGKGRRRVLVVAVALVAVVVVATARAASVISETTWGGPLSEVTNGAAVASDGSSYLTGFTNSFDPSGQQVFLTKFAGDGSLSWQRTFQGPEQFRTDEGKGVAVTPDGSVYVTGQTVGVQGDVLLLKFSPDGALEWQRRWDGGGRESGEAVAVASDGAVYVTGGTDSFGGFGHLFVLRFAPDGSLVWQRMRSVATDAAVGTGQSIAVGSDGSIYAAGVSPRTVIGEFDMLLLKLDHTGALVWQRTYSTGDVADARGGVTVAPDGTVVVAGGIQEVGRRTAVNDTFVSKFGSDGTLIWDRGFGGDQGDFPGGVATRSEGTILVGGETGSFGAGGDDAFLLQLDPGGRGLACNTWGGPGSDHGDDVELAPDGTVVLGGTTESPSPATFGTCPRQVKRLRAVVAAPVVPLTDATGAVADPNGTVATPNGTSPGAGGFDAALVRIAP